MNQAIVGLVSMAILAGCGSATTPKASTVDAVAPNDTASPGDVASTGADSVESSADSELVDGMVGDVGDAGAGVAISYIMGSCGPNKPGYGSCLVQAILGCIRPSGSCSSDSTNTMTWSDGGQLSCTEADDEQSFSCSAQGPDGAACLSITGSSYGGSHLGGSFAGTISGKAFKAVFAPSHGAVLVTCPDGSEESYATAADMCSPFKAPCGSGQIIVSSDAGP